MLIWGFMDWEKNTINYIFTIRGVGYDYWLDVLVQEEVSSFNHNRVHRDWRIKQGAFIGEELAIKKCDAITRFCHAL